MTDLKNNIAFNRYGWARCWATFIYFDHEYSALHHKIKENCWIWNSKTISFKHLISCSYFTKESIIKNLTESTLERNWNVERWNF